MQSWWKSVKTVKSHYASKRVKAKRQQHQFVARCCVCQALFRTARSHASCCSTRCRMKRSRLKVAGNA